MLSAPSRTVDAWPHRNGLARRWTIARGEMWELTLFPFVWRFRSYEYAGGIQCGDGPFYDVWHVGPLEFSIHDD